MPQLSTTQADTEPLQASSAEAPADERVNSPTKSREWTKLGYEVFNKRRTARVQVPLSVSANSGSSSYTGSALLDSFVRDRKVEPPALQTLRLINVAESPDPKSATSEVFSKQDSAKQTTAIQDDSSSALLNRPPAPAESLTEIQEALPEDLKQLGHKDQTVDTQISARALEGSVASESAFEPTSKRTSGTAPETTPDSVEINELLVELPEPELDSAEPSSTQIQPDQDLLDQPPSEAEPEQLDASAADISAAPHVPVPQPKQRPPQPPSGPAFSSSHRTNLPAVNHEKRARDSAASVGLIDITDTLLFGGDRPDLVSADPFIPQGSEANIPGVLAYLTKQVSAFTVDRLQSGFPHNTDPRVINRLDPPKRNSVLDVENFNLGDLTDSNQGPKKLTRQSPKTSQSPEDISSLSQQVEDLNRKIAYLSQKLAQVADTAE